MDEIIIGTYEGFLLGYSLSPEENETKLKQTFATHSHASSVRCVSTAGKFLASGGTDDKVVVIDLKTRKEHTVLMNHDGTVNDVAFTKSGTHLISGSDDGSIIVTRTGNWQIEKIWKKAHGGQPVVGIAVHPSDKLALSIGGDKTLRTWNLVKGRPAFTINLGSKGVTLPTEIKFSPGGDRFSLISLQTVDIWTISKAGLEKRITCNSKPTCVQWISDDKIIVGLDNGNIISLLVSDTEAVTCQAHKHRVKSLHFDNNLLYSVSSTGEIKIWSMGDQTMKALFSKNTDSRVTCLVLSKQNSILKKEVDLEEKEDEEISKNESSITKDSDDSEEEEIIVLPPSKRPGAFVSINYDKNNKNQDQPPVKKSKKRIRNKKGKNKQSKEVL